jgi:acyl-coenzyme A synthetase/AMP-(fatty) acid ligase
MYKAFRDKTPFEIESVLEQMARVNEIIVVDVRPGPQGGRPTKRYRLAAV